MSGGDAASVANLSSNSGSNFEIVGGYLDITGNNGVVLYQKARIVQYFNCAAAHLKYLGGKQDIENAVNDRIFARVKKFQSNGD
jgi:hypothetical protein